MKNPGKKLYQQLVSSIQEAIGQGRYTKGMRLPGERELAEEYAVSRPTVREAMIALEIYGLVEARHGSGLYVTAEPDRAAEPKELDIGAFELIEARVLFEGETAAVAAAAIDDEALRDLDGLLDEMAAHEPASPEALEADRRFHLRIAEATDNTVICSVVNMLWNLRHGAPLSAHMFAEAHREGIHPRVEEHRLIVDALRERSPEDARRAMRDHLKRVTEDLLVATEQQALRRTRDGLEQQRAALKRRLHDDR